MNYFGFYLFSTSNCQA
ncbi:MAG: hypothetical protein LBH60_05820 [Prevotellaceae bacterium]|nr:hypothetical protein [Prevotellaceae bacterium]